MGVSVDVVIPVLNESVYIRGCIESVLRFEIPDQVRISIYILDGGSTDDTKALALDYASKHSNIIVKDNPGRIQSCALNIVIREGTGDYLLRLDAHSFYPEDYLRLCLETALRTGADNVGGVFITKPGGTNYQARLVQALTTHRFGVGDSEFRLDAKEQAADTVPYGFFQKAIFDRIGLFDERLVRAQDYEINRRIISSDGRVWLNPNIRVFYHNQPNLVQFYRKQVEKEAPYNAYLWWVAPYAFAVRHAITGVFATGVLGGLILSPFSQWILWPFLAVMGLYALLAILSAYQQAVKYKNPTYLFVLPGCFFLYHFLHGIGVIVGVLRLLTHTAPVQQKKEPWLGAGRLRAWPNDSNTKRHN
ncbi:MAG: glycosyltransferase family 2 protein [Magnetococcales bacterium]|nr:glycosyltransferase family 2 protein [Magnetococcales bacterium]NGZ25587.1 glycosyltransferase family 2 protein [Magnetococcales bacterium]